MLKFDASIFGGELPVGLGVVGIALVLPGGDFVDEDLFVGNAAIEALRRGSASQQLLYRNLLRSHDCLLASRWRPKRITKSFQIG
jgi:hypothetical protein